MPEIRLVGWVVGWLGEWLVHANETESRPPDSDLL